MSVTFRTQHRRGDGSNPTHISLTVPGRCVVDGEHIDLYYAADHDEDAWQPRPDMMILRRGDDWEYTYIPISDAETLPESTEVEYADADLPVYPVWPDGEAEAPQTVTSTNSWSLAGKTDLELTKKECRAMLAQLDVWSRALDAEGVAHPVSDVQDGHDFLAYLHWGLYLYATTSLTGVLWLNKRLRIKTMQSGAADCSTARDYLAKAHTLTSSQRPAANTPLLLVDPSTGVAWNLNEIVENSAIEFAKSKWDGVELDVSDIDIRSGVWIDSLGA